MKILWFYSTIAIVRGNHRLTILDIPIPSVLNNTTEERIITFAYGYMINPPWHVKKVFRDQVENSQN